MSGKTFCVYGQEYLTLRSFSTIPKAVCRVKSITIQIAMPFFSSCRQADCQIHTASQRVRIAKTVLQKRNKIGGLTLPDLKTYSTATAITVMWCWPQDRYTDQRNGTEFRNVPVHLWPAGFWQGFKSSQRAKEESLQQVVLGQLDVHFQKDKVGSLTHVMYKNQLNMLQWAWWKPWNS